MVCKEFLNEIIVAFFVNLGQGGKMAAVNNLLEYIANDVEKYEGIMRHEKSGLLKRIFTNKVDPRELHPNPADEFSMPEIGPNMEIVENYGDIVDQALLLRLPIFDEPIIIEKMSPDGYMLLNGHHRWAAALKRDVKKVRVRLVNVTHEADVHRVLGTVKNVKRATFDIDDIVFAKEGDQEEPISFPYNLVYKHRMKLGIAALMQNLWDRGYDIWVFTSEYHSREYYRRFFQIHGVEVTGIVNGMDTKKAKRTEKKESLWEAFRNQYKMSITVLKDSIIYNNAATREFEKIDINREELDASKNVLEIIEKIDHMFEGSENV